MSFESPLSSEVLEPIDEVQSAVDENNGKAFPYSSITLEMKERMVKLFEELEVKPFLKDIFEKSYEDFHLKLKPRFWWHEFIFEKQKYLFSYFGQDVISISTQGLTLEVSLKLKSSIRWKKAMSLLCGDNHSSLVQKKFYKLIESISVDLIKKAKIETLHNDKGFYLSSFVNTWQNTMKGSSSDFYNFISGFFYERAKSYLKDLDDKHRLEKQIFDKSNSFSVSWSLILNEKKLNRRLMIASKKDPKFKIKKTGKMLRKIRSYYDAEVIRALYRNHVFSANMANWLSHEDPKVRKYRIQALDSHKVLIPYFKNFNKGSEVFSSNECLFFTQNNKFYHHDNYEKVEDVFKRMFTTSQVFENNNVNFPILSSEELFQKVENGLKSIDEGASVDHWILEILNECSFISSAPLVYQHELKQLLKTGFRRMKGKSTSLAAFMSGGYWNILRLVEFLLYLGLMDNGYQVKNPKQAKERLNHIHHNLLNKTLMFILPYHLAHPSKKERAISLKEYFAMVSTLNGDSWSQSSWGELLTSSSLRDAFSWYFKVNFLNNFDGFDTLYRGFLNCFVLKGLFPSLKNWDVKMHEIQGRLERENECSDANLSWLPLVKQKESLVLDGVEFRELICNYELKKQGQKEEHCVGGYYWHCIRGDSRIFSLEKNGTILSTLEINQAQKHGHWIINQNHAARNKKASLESQKAANHFIKMLKSKKSSELFNVISFNPNVENKYYAHLRELEEIKQEKLKEEVRKATEKDFFQIHQILSLAEKLYFAPSVENKNYYLIKIKERAEVREP